MPFDPTQPVNGILVDANFLRAQFNGLNDNISTIPVGPQGPQGNDGPAGSPGADGSDGAPGPQGIQGPPFASAVVDSVNTLNPGDAATVGVSFDGTSVHFTYGIPRGADGANGADGTNGADGAPGEVTNAALAAAIAGTSANTNAVATLDTPFTNDPPTLADIEVLRQAFNALVLALRR